MGESELDISEWLGEKFEGEGRTIGLADAVIEALVKAEEEDVWGVDDIPSKEVDVKGVEGAIDFFKAAYEDGAKMLKKQPLASGKVCIEQWMKARYVLDGIMMDGITPKKKSPELLADLAAHQGMTHEYELLGLELALLLGRAVAKEELVGGSYGRPPAAMDGAKVQSKTNKRLKGSPDGTFDEILASALEGGGEPGRGSKRAALCQGRALLRPDPVGEGAVGHRASEGARRDYGTPWRRHRAVGGGGADGGALLQVGQSGGSAEEHRRGGPGAARRRYGVRPAASARRSARLVDNPPMDDRGSRRGKVATLPRLLGRHESCGANGLVLLAECGMFARVSSRALTSRSMTFAMGSGTSPLPRAAKSGSWFGIRGLAV